MRSVRPVLLFVATAALGFTVESQAQQAPKTIPVVNAIQSLPGRPPGTAAASLPAEYQILNRKSIFLKDRGNSEAKQLVRPPLSQPSPKPQPVPILVGVLLGDSAQIAYIEEPGAEKLWALAAGDPLPANLGVVRHVHQYGIEITRDDASSCYILVGQNLAGAAAPVRPLETPAAVSHVHVTKNTQTEPPSLSDSSSPDYVPANARTPDGAEALSIEDAMRARRLQDLGQ